MSPSQHHRTGRRARLIDVAREAGVSPKTVSNYVHDYPFMSERTTARVRAAIEKLGYRPNQSAQTLRTGRTGLVGLALPDLSVPYFAELAALVTEAAEALGFTLLIDQTKGDADRERRVVSGLGSHALDGLIISPMALGVDELAEIDRQMPLVVLGERPHPAGVPYVGVDNVAAARAAAQHLVDLGRTRIAAIGRVQHRPGGTWVPRLAGYAAVLTAAGLPTPVDRQPVISRFDRSEGERAMTELLALPEPPDAVFCFSDLLAVGALAVLHRSGVAVPEAVALVGWDDIAESRYAWPPITTVRADTEEVARIAVRRLAEQILGTGDLDDPGAQVDPPGHPESATADTLVEFTIIRRASTVG